MRLVLGHVDHDQALVAVHLGCREADAGGGIHGLGHVGGKTALAWRGFGHNVPAREPLWLWGERNFRLPDWFTERFPARYTTRTPFAPSLPVGTGLEPLPDQPEGVRVSVPERALLEMLSEVGILKATPKIEDIIDTSFIK